MMLGRRELLLLLFYAEGWSGKVNEEIKGRLKLMKIAFLLEEEGDIRKYFEDFYQFEPLNYGPFSRELMKDLEMLIQEGLIREKSSEVNTVIGSKMIRSNYELTEKGIEYAEKIKKEDPESVEIIIKISEIKKRYNRIDTERLLTYVYSKYPEFTTNSKIVDDILA